jgi:hypothetical protein
MRKTHDLEPRVSAANASDSTASSNASWMPAGDFGRAVLDPARWSRRARQERYWRMVEIWNRQRRLH